MSVFVVLFVAKYNVPLKKRWETWDHRFSLIYNMAKMNFAYYVTSHIMKSRIHFKTDFLRSCWFTTVLNSSEQHRSCWGCESTAAPWGMDRKHRLCVSTARYRGPPEAGGWVVRLSSHLITSDPCRSTLNAPLTNTQVHSIITTHTHMS